MTGTLPPALDPRARISRSNSKPSITGILMSDTTKSRRAAEVSAEKRAKQKGWQRLFSVNLDAVWKASQVVGNQMAARGTGSTGSPSLIMDD
jgi:hypothetical protein